MKQYISIKKELVKKDVKIKAITVGLRDIMEDFFYFAIIE